MVSDPKHVLVYVHSWLPRQCDGVAVRFLAHVRELVRRGIKVTLVTPDFEAAKFRGDFVKVEGVEHIQLSTSFTPGYKREAGKLGVMCPKSSINSLMTLVGVLRKVKPDLVHMAQCASMVMVSTACLVVNVPLVMSIHTDLHASKSTTTGISVQLSDFGLLFSWLFGASFFPVSSNAHAILEGAGIGGTKGIMRWGPMVDTNIFRVDQDKEKVAAERKRLTHGHPERFLVTYVGRFSLEKNLKFLVEGLKRAPENVTLALVGDGPLGEEFAELSKELMPRLFCEPKFLGREEVALALAASDIGASASCMETTGFCAIESIACGTPFLAANALGFAEHLSDGVNARLFKPDDTASMLTALAEFNKEKEEGRMWKRDALRASVNHACLSDCSDRALVAYGQRLERPRVVTLLLAPIAFIFFVYNALGEVLMDQEMPEFPRAICLIPIGSFISLLLPSARALRCPNRLMMWACMVRFLPVGFFLLMSFILGIFTG